jgi:RNA recognition motif-containing protein
MSSSVYVDNLAVSTTARELVNLFSAYGDVEAVSIAVDLTSHNPGCFGFVTMVTPEAARSAVRALNGTALGAQTLTASEPWPNKKRAVRPKARSRSS